MTDPNQVTGERKPANTDPTRELALVLALDFHKEADTDDPRTVVETAQEFLSFLGGDVYVPKHAAPGVYNAEQKRHPRGLAGV